MRMRELGLLHLLSYVFTLFTVNIYSRVELSAAVSYKCYPLQAEAHLDY